MKEKGEEEVKDQRVTKMDDKDACANGREVFT